MILRAKKTAGFTLIELLVVVIIIGVLAAIGIPQYTKTMENSKNDDAQAAAKMIGTTNRMYRLDHTIYASGSSTYATADNTYGTCSGSGDYRELISCKYLATQDWDSKPYAFRALDGNTSQSPCTDNGTSPTASTYVACGFRKSGSPPGTNSSYKTWVVTVDINGKLCTWPAAGTTCPCPTGC